MKPFTLAAPFGGAVAALLLLIGCTPAERSLWSFCSDSPAAPVASPSPAPTYHGDIEPIVQTKCVRCHQAGGTAPFSLEGYRAVVQQAVASQRAIDARHMPPWLAAPCCAEYRDNYDLTEEERSTFAKWVATGAPEGEATEAPPPKEAVGGLDRVDFTFQLPEPYTPSPKPGTTDDTRCFLFDWPYDKPMFVTGFNVRPGNRAIVHHLVLAFAKGDDAKQLAQLDRRSPEPGFDCGGGIGSGRVMPFGGSLGASRLPEGYGQEIPPRAKIVFNIHYSVARVQGQTFDADATAVDFRVASQGKPLNAIVVQNPAWLIGDSMHVAAGDPEAIYYYRFKPTLFTGGKRVWVHAAVPHMHAFGSKIALGILRADGSKDCLLEIPHWHFGWEQHYWLKAPKVLNPEDQVFVECRFDNSESNQPIVNGVRQKPRDFAWGGDDQDMCVGFLTFAKEP